MNEKQAGRPLQYGSHKIQTTVRLPQSVIDFLKAEYGKVQSGIDKLVIEPAIVAGNMSAPVIGPIVVDEESPIIAYGHNDRQAVLEFVARVNKRAEQSMEKTGKLEGMHYAAMQVELARMEADCE